MPVVWIPALLRDLTGGATQVNVTGSTLREVIEGMEMRYPGVKARLVEDEWLRPNITVIVDGVTSQKRLRERLTEDSEIHFVPTISGGTALFAKSPPFPSSPKSKSRFGGRSVLKCKIMIDFIGRAGYNSSHDAHNFRYAAD